MRHAIDQPARRHRADAFVVIGIDFIDVAPFEFGFLAGVIESPVAAQEMDGAEDEIEPVPVLLDPGAARGGVDRIVIQLDPGADFEIGIGCAQPVDLVEVDAGVVAIVIRQGDIAQADVAGVIGPRLEELLRVGLEAMPLRMQMVIGEEPCHE